MIRLYEGKGSGEIDLQERAMSGDEWDRLRNAVLRLLRARSHPLAVEMLEKIPFELHNGTNWFGDDFRVLYAPVPLERYTKLGEAALKPTVRTAATQVAQTFQELDQYVRFIAVALETNPGPEPVATPSLLISSASVERALEDAALLIRSRGAPSAVDRAHTALHGYLRAAGERAGLSVAEDQSVGAMFRVIRTNHPAFAEAGPRGADIAKVCNAFGAVLDALNPLRNRASNAHPNDEVLGEPEAMLVINAVRTILHYLDAKLE